MAAKQMEYVGTAPLEVVIPEDGQVVELSKGDVVDWAHYGGDQFFAGRDDFRVKPARAKKGGSTSG